MCMADGLRLIISTDSSYIDMALHVSKKWQEQNCSICFKWTAQKAGSILS